MVIAGGAASPVCSKEETMKKGIKMSRRSRTLLAGVLTAAMAIQPMTAFAAGSLPETQNEETTVLTIESVEANSYQSGNEASLAIDGNTGTHWHSSWDTGHPVVADGLYITMDLGQETAELSQLTYTPRQDKDYNGIYTE